MSDAINITVTPPATQTTNVVVTPPPQTVVNISTNNSALAISPTVYPVARPGARFALSPSVVKNGDIITCFGNPEIFTLTFVSAITDTTTFEVKFYDDNDDDPAIWDAPACATTSIAATAFATWINDYGVFGSYLISTVGDTVTIGRYSYLDATGQTLNNCSTIGFVKIGGNGTMATNPTVTKIQSMDTPYGGTWIVADHNQIHTEQGYLYSNWLSEAPNNGQYYVRQNKQWVTQPALNPFNQTLNNGSDAQFGKISTLNNTYQTRYDDGFTGPLDFWQFGNAAGGGFDFAYTGTNVFTIAPDGAIIFSPQTSTPSAHEGAIYYNSTTHHFYGYNGTAWKQLDNTL